VIAAIVAVARAARSFARDELFSFDPHGTPADLRESANRFMM